MSSEFIDSAANVLALFIIIAVPIGGIALFWLVHVLPEKIAEKRHHPQKDAIHVLCLLSLVFGGLLWPLAWLWAFSKPVLYKLAYGRDRADEYYENLPAGPAAGASDELRAELARLRQDIEGLEDSGQLASTLHSIRNRIAELESRVAADAHSVVEAR